MIIKTNQKKNIEVLLRAVKWHINYYLFNRPFPLIATFQLTNVCNYKCKMCNLWRNPKKNTIPLPLFKGYIDDLAKMGCCYVSLSGGEPLIIKNIDNYVYYSKQKIAVVNLVTNGFSLNKDMASRLNKSNLDTLSISIDAMKKKHDQIRGVKGAFDNAINAINNIKVYAPHIQIVINTVISPWNIEDIPKLIELTEHLNVYQKFQPINQHPLYDNQKTKKIKYKVTQDFMNKLNMIIKTVKKKKNILNSKYFLSSIPDFFLNKNTEGLFDEDCNLGYYYCDIRENKEIYPCLNGMYAKNGFSIQKGLKKVYTSPEYKRMQKRLVKCRYCQKDFQICHLEPRIAFPIRNFLKYKLGN